MKEGKKMTAEKEYQRLYEKMAKLCEENNWGDPFNYARSKEIYAATVLGHQIAEEYSGPDAYLKDGSPVEYKSTIAKVRIQEFQYNQLGQNKKNIYEKRRLLLIQNIITIGFVVVVLLNLGKWMGKRFLSFCCQS